MQTRELFIDIETYSDVDLASCGLFRYAQSPAFEILLLAYSLDGAPVQILDLTQPGSAIPWNLRQLLTDPAVIKHAYNAAFEWYCLTRYFKQSDTWAAGWVRQWRCSMLHGMYVGYPAGLAAIGASLGLAQEQQKMTVGSALIKYFCKPCAPTKVNGGRTRNLPSHDPAKWELFKEYNARDVETEMAVDKCLEHFPVPEEIQRQWELDQIINLRGVLVDMELVSGALAIGTTERAELLEEARELSGLDNPNSVKQLAKWLEKEIGEEIPQLRKEDVRDLLGRELPSAAATRMLQLRVELGKTSTKKYDAIDAGVCSDGRVRGLLQFYGANRTGREAGRLVQVQNLPHDVIPATAEARELVKRRNAEGLRMIYGSIMQPLSALIRTALVPGPGSVFIDADFSAIEARVIAWLAKENWVLDVFRTHGKIYEATAAAMFGIPIELIKKGNTEYAYRAKGKVATLALGYQGGTGALKKMGALRSGLTEEELPDIVTRWRNSNPSIVAFWYAVEAAALQAVEQGSSGTVGPVRFARELDAAHGLDFMTITLPSGRKLYYARPGIGKNQYGKPSITYWGQNQTTKKWGLLETFGGKLAENITQAVARDCLFFALENLEAAGFRVVFDVHDEVVIEAPEDNADLHAVTEIMSRSVPWAPDLPLAAEGWTDYYFKKD